MKKYKFKIGQEVYHSTAALYYASQTKKRQKPAMKVVARGTTDNGVNIYFLKTSEGTYTSHAESVLTPNKEKILGYILLKGPNDFEVLEEPVEEVKENEVLLTVMGVDYA